LLKNALHAPAEHSQVALSYKKPPSGSSVPPLKPEDDLIVGNHYATLHYHQA